MDNNFQTKLPPALIEFVGLVVLHVIGLIAHVDAAAIYNVHLFIDSTSINVEVAFRSILLFFLVKNFLPEGYTLLSVTVPVYLQSGC